MVVIDSSEIKPKEQTQIMLVNEEEMMLVLRQVFGLEPADDLPGDFADIDCLDLFTRTATLDDEVSPTPESIITNSNCNNCVPISPRQTEILKYVAEGLSNKSIADRLGISQHTVKNMIASIKNKLGTSDRTQSVVLSMSCGWLSIDEV